MEVNGISTLLNQIFDIYSSTFEEKNEDNNTLNTILNSSTQLLTISKLGSSLSELYQKITDEDTKVGFRDLVTALLQNPDSTNILTFLIRGRDLLENDADTFNQLIDLKDIIEEKGYDLSKWLNTYLSISDSTLSKKFLEETAKILEGEDASFVFDNFLNMVKNLKGNNETLEDFLNNIENLETAEEKWRYIEEYKSKIGVA